ncbi:MAG: ATP-binding protein [Verrucomicrobiota bacterium]
MNSFQYIPLTAAGFNLALALFVFARNPRQTLNQVFLLWGSSVAVWNLGVFMMFRVQTHADAMFWAKFLQMGVIVLPFSLYHICLQVAQVPARRLVILLYSMMGVFLVLNAAGYFVKDVRNVPEMGAYYTLGGGGFFVFFVVYIIFTVSILGLLYRKQAAAPLLYRQRLRSLLLAIGIIIAFGVNDILPILGMFTYPFTDRGVVPLGSAAALFFALIVAYSVLQFQLLNIQLTLSRVAAQLLRTGFLFFTGLVLLVLLYFVSPAQFTPFAFMSALAVLLASSLLAAWLFPRLFGKGEEKLERYFLGDWFEYQEKVRGLIQNLPYYTEQQTLMTDLHHFFVDTIKVKSYTIVLLDEVKRAFTSFQAHPEQPSVPLPELTVDSPVLHFFRDTQADYLVCKQYYVMPGETRQQAAARSQLEPLDAEFCFPFFSGQEPFGLLLLGEKQSDDPYTKNDVQLLSDLVKHLGLSLNQIRLKNQVLRAEELELLGIMSRGIAHDLNNLTTPVWTYLQLAGTDTNQQELNENLLPVARRSMESIRSYIEKARFFARTPQLQLTRVTWSDLIHETIQTVHDRIMDKHLTVSVQNHADGQVDVDEVMMHRLLGNLLLNAIEASFLGGTIEIRVTPLPRVQSDRSWFRLTLTDHGEGIQSENLKLVGRPYFSTKNTGNNQRGAGLGLAISQKIVALHGGHFSLSSRLNHGTTIQVDLPDHPPVESPIRQP